MNTTILQVPISKALRDEAAATVSNMGFSSLQEFIRVMLTQLKNNYINMNLEPKPVALSPKAAARYDKMAEEIETGKVKTLAADSVDDLMDQLHR